jgi:hypothetical protein
MSPIETKIQNQFPKNEVEFSDGGALRVIERAFAVEAKAA